MATKLGLKCKLYRNTGTYGAPTWVEVKRIRDNVLNLEKGEADVSTRAGNGWRERVATLKDGGCDFMLLQAPSGVDADFAAIRDSWLLDSDIEFLVLDGAIGVAGVQGLRVTMQVFTFTRNEALEEAVGYDVSIKPTPADNPPAWVTY